MQDAIDFLFQETNIFGIAVENLVIAVVGFLAVWLIYSALTKPFNDLH
jgi:hypothetical protein